MCGVKNLRDETSRESQGVERRLHFLVVVVAAVVVVVVTALWVHAQLDQVLQRQTCASFRW